LAGSVDADFGCLLVEDEEADSDEVEDEETESEEAYDELETM